MPMQADLSSAHRKLERALEHLYRIERQIRVWHQSNPYRPTLQDDPDAPGYRWLGIMHIDKRPDFVGLSARFGDMIQNFRSALDHAVYAFALAHHGTLTLKQERSLQFPIASTADEWIKQQGWIDLVPMRVRAEIKRLQPLNRVDTSEHGALAMIRDFNNADKHRLLHIVDVLPSRATVKPRTPISGRFDAVFETGLLKDGAPFVTMTTTEHNAKMGVDYDLGIDVAVRKAWTEPQPFINLGLVLGVLRFATRTALGELDRLAR